MNKIKQMMFMVVLLATVFTACGQKDFVTTESGLKYIKVVEGTGEKPVNGQFVLINIAYFDPNGHKMYSSLDNGMQQPVNYVDSVFTNDGSIGEGFKMCGKGDSIVLKVNAKTLFEKSLRRSLPDSIDADGEITVNLGVTEILTAEDYKKYRMDQMVKAQVKAREEAEKRLADDVITIDAYLEKNGIKADSTAEGLRYVISKPGEGPMPEKGQTVVVNYTGRLLDGTMFDSSIEEDAKQGGVYRESRDYNEPFEFPLGQGRVIKGWDLGIALLNKGAKAKLYIPSPLGYGPRGTGAIIKPNSILVFEVELVDIK